ncbi:MAG TPA: phage tail protein [Prolixibacteraceae bacterium]|nr:phage tail protein [Prolixibacteraceae bacterium]
MATTYKTPGVYVEEIAKFPPSVAQVETAIPAFIGYTEKASRKETDDLILNPFRITSLLEYETYYGGADLETGIEVKITDTTVNGVQKRTITVPQPSTKSPFRMYYALRLYFANGGGPCYITAVNTYTAAVVANAVAPVQLEDLQEGLAEIEKEDEPTLLLFPDATALSSDNFYAIYKDALTQCNKLQDRFTILDTHTDDETDDPTPSEGLRDGINLEKDYLKYGAAYYPFIETLMNYNYNTSAVTIDHVTDDSPVLFDTLEDVNIALDEINEKLDDSGDLVTALSDAKTAIDALTAAEALAQSNLVTDAIQPLVDLLDSVITSGTDVVASANFAAAASSESAPVAAACTAAAAALTSGLGGAIATMKTALEGHITTIESAVSGTAVKTETTNAVATASTIETVINGIISLIDPPVIQAITAAQAADTNGELDGLKLNVIEKTDSTTFNEIKTSLSKLYVKMPPSGAIAGVYARVDRDRGVWKAPANVGLNYVIRPSVKITNDMQDGLNVDTTAGKSINAIRSFTGKGTLVWGARTLAGNDNEWRYVSVRRFFNMVEESVKKATAQFVFEPNDANTWVKVRAMIENFLILQWRAGALAGAKPDEAFYVRVGLGQTMTAEDILNGFMHIEIGMAVVRPAEFIILKFSHKLQQS